MQRSMSYRKPVPEYIPSPPPSPTNFAEFQLSNTPTQPEESQAHTPAIQEGNSVGKPIPPLPENWREILAESIAEANIVDSTNDRHIPRAKSPLSEDHSSNKQVHTVLRSQSRSTGFLDGDQESFSTVAPSQLVYLRPQRKNGRGLPTTYRPPTPPLRSKQTLNMTEKCTNDGQMPQMYLSNPYSTYVRVGFPSPGTSSVIRPTPSFRTERTLASMNTTNISMGWPSGYPASSERVLDHYPMQKPNTDELTAPDGRSLTEGSEEMGCLKFWCNTTKLGSWVKKLKLTSH